MLTVLPWRGPMIQWYRLPSAFTASTKRGITPSDFARTSWMATTSNWRTTRARISTTCGLAIFDSPNTWMLNEAMRTASHGLEAGSTDGPGAPPMDAGTAAPAGETASAAWADGAAKPARIAVVGWDEACCNG